MSVKYTVVFVNSGVLRIGGLAGMMNIKRKGRGSIYDWTVRLGLRTKELKRANSSIVLRNENGRR